jgi:CRP-like cAMP-binding protein
VGDQRLLTQLVERWARRGALPDADRQALLALPATQKSYSRDAYLVREGEATTSCAVLLTGMAFRQKLVSSGARQIISFHIPGEFLDLQNLLLGIADHNVQCLTTATVAVVPKAPLLDLMTARPAIARALWEDSLIDSSVFREWVVNVGRRNAKSRISHLLCELMLRMRTAGLCGDTTCHFPLTQEHLADATGLTSVHTNRTLQTLRKAGLIQLRANRLTVLDWHGLAEVGDFTERYLHHSV